MGAIDIVVNLFTAQELELGQTGIDSDFMTQVRMPDDMRGGVSIDRYLQKMDRAGIDRSAADRCPRRRPQGQRLVRDSLRPRPFDLHGSP